MSSTHGTALAEAPPRQTPDLRRTVGVPGSLAVRLAALGGFIFFALFIAFASLTQGFPSATDTRQEIFTYIVDHQDRLQLAAVLYGLAMPAVLLLLSGLFRALRRAEGGSPGLSVAALAGGILAAASTAVGALILGTTANRLADIGVGGVRIWSTMFLLTMGATLLGLLLLIGATAVVSVRTHLFAGWFSFASVVLALASVAGAFTIGYASDAIQTVAGIAAILDVVWILLVSIFLWRDRDLMAP